MENQEKGLTVNIGEYKGEKPIEVVYSELAEDYRDKCIDEVLDGIRAIAPDIAILEI